MSRLDRQGYRYLAAGSAEEAESLVQAHGSAISLLVTDIVMPGRSGAALAASLHARFPELRGIVMSGYAPDIARGEIGGDAAFLAKPLAPADLLHLVREVLNESPTAKVADPRSGGHFGTCGLTFEPALVRTRLERGRLLGARRPRRPL